MVLLAALLDRAEAWERGLGFGKVAAKDRGKPAFLMPVAERPDGTVSVHAWINEAAGKPKWG